MSDVCPASVMVITTGHLQSESIGAISEVKSPRAYFCCDCMGAFTKKEAYRHARAAMNEGEGPVNAALTIKAGMR